jgi:hypothetical protein
VIGFGKVCLGIFASKGCQLSKIEKYTRKRSSEVIHFNRLQLQNFNNSYIFKMTRRFVSKGFDDGLNHLIY